MINYEKPRRSGRGRTNTVRGNVPSNSTPIFALGKVVGEVRENIFYKKIKGSRHLLRKPHAIASDINSLLQAKLTGATRMEVVDVETGYIYRATIEEILEKGIEFNRGFGDQIAYPLEMWNIEHIRENKKPNPQMSIFGG